MPSCSKATTALTCSRTGPTPNHLKRRIRSKHGHLSNHAAARCLQTLGKDVPQVILAHLSETNNTPEQVMASAREGLGLFYEETTLVIATQCGTSGPARNR